MDYRKIIKEIGRGKNHARDLDRDTARGLYAICSMVKSLTLSWAAY
ncbi:putative glycosyl transferase [Escherichia coli]|nr:putative glycosyl transferase [Escherichia coli]